MKGFIEILIFLFITNFSFSQMDPFDSLKMVNVIHNDKMIKKTDLDKVEKLIVDYINGYRKSKGKNVLTYSSELSLVGRKWSDSLVEEGLLNEMGILRLRHSKGPYIENCYAQARFVDLSKLDSDFFYIETPKSVYDAWYNSKGHNAGMLMNGTSIGVGISFGVRSDGQMFIVASMEIK
jgi:uncharacterized protein YkwD